MKPKRKARVIWVAESPAGDLYCRFTSLSKTELNVGWRYIQFIEVVKKRRKG